MKKASSKKKQKKSNLDIDIEKIKLKISSLSKKQENKDENLKDLAEVNRDIEKDDINEEFFEEFIEEEDNNFRTLRRVNPSLQQRQILNLEEDLADVPTEKKEENPTNVNYASAKSSYSQNIASSYAQQASNMPNYSASPEAMLRKTDESPSLGFNQPAANDFRKWQQSMAEQQGQNQQNQQENYRTFMSEKIDNSQQGLPFERRKREKFM